MKKKDFIILAAVLLLSALLWLVFRFEIQTHSINEPQNYQVRIKVCGELYQTISLNKTQQIEIKQENNAHNVVSIFENGFKMHSANCKNQSCIHQGTVTVENYQNRILNNMIVCLPNQVTLELIKN